MKPDLTSAVGRLLEDTYKEAYRAGLRRAQELAKELSYVWYRNHDVQKYVVVQLDSLNQAIDAEAKKG